MDDKIGQRAYTVGVIDALRRVVGHKWMWGTYNSYPSPIPRIGRSFREEELAEVGLPIVLGFAANALVIGGIGGLVLGRRRGRRLGTLSLVCGAIAWACLGAYVHTLSFH